MDVVTMDGSGNVLGDYDVDTPVVPTSSSNTQIAATLVGNIVLAGNGSAFSTFMVNFVQASSNNLELTLAGSTTTSVTTSIGTIILTLNNLQVTSYLTGMTEY